MSLPTTVIWLSILMLIPAALVAGLVLTGILMFFGRRLVMAPVTRLRAAWLSWRASLRAVPERASSATVSPAVGVSPVVRTSLRP